jgi:hypothetical protein
MKNRLFRVADGGDATFLDQVQALASFCRKKRNVPVESTFPALFADIFFLACTCVM